MYPRTRYQIDDVDTPAIRSMPLLREIPPFLIQIGTDLDRFDSFVLVPPSMRSKRPRTLGVHVFHQFETAYDAIDAAADSLAEFYEATDVFPIIVPWAGAIVERVEDLNPWLAKLMAGRGVLIRKDMVK